MDDRKGDMLIVLTLLSALANYLWNGHKLSIGKLPSELTEPNGAHILKKGSEL